MQDARMKQNRMGGRDSEAGSSSSSSNSSSGGSGGLENALDGGVGQWEAESGVASGSFVSDEHSQVHWLPEERGEGAQEGGRNFENGSKISGIPIPSMLNAVRHCHPYHNQLGRGTTGVGSETVELLVVDMIGGKVPQLLSGFTPGLRFPVQGQRQDEGQKVDGDHIDDVKEKGKNKYERKVAEELLHLEHEPEREHSRGKFHIGQSQLVGSESSGPGSGSTRSLEKSIERVLSKSNYEHQSSLLLPFSVLLANSNSPICQIGNDNESFVMSRPSSPLDIGEEMHMVTGGFSSVVDTPPSIPKTYVVLLSDAIGLSGNTGANISGDKSAAGASSVDKVPSHSNVAPGSGTANVQSNQKIFAHNSFQLVCRLAQPLDSIILVR